MAPFPIPGLPHPAGHGIDWAVHWIKAMVAFILAIVWLPAVSCCLVDASGLFAKRNCCAKEHSQTTPGPGHCDQPCGALASATYFPPPSQWFVMAPIDLPLFDCADVLSLTQPAVRANRSFPATAPPELAGHWQFAFRTALPARAPSLAS